ncbi:MAG: hypothetical protein NVSMB18_24060 [Acetobacteraceae bacterium]
MRRVRLAAEIHRKARGVFADPVKMRLLNHKGRFYQVKGLLNITRPPQGHPVIMQAGASDAGRDFAAATAEVVFTAQQDLAEALTSRKTCGGVASRSAAGPTPFASCPASTR